MPRREAEDVFLDFNKSKAHFPMSTEQHETGRHRRDESVERRFRRRAEPVLITVAVFASVWAGLAFQLEGSRIDMILPPLTLLGGILLMLSLVKFEIFLGALLATRSGLDAAKIGSSVLDVTGALALLFLGMGLIWLAVQRSQLGKVPENPLFAPLLALLVAGSFSLIASLRPVEGATHLVRIAAVLVLLQVLNRLVTSIRRLKFVLLAFFASALIPLLFGSFQLLTGAGSVARGGFERITGSFLHPNPFAIYLTFLFLVGLALYRHLGWSWRIALLPILAGSGIQLLFTFTRSAWIAAIAGLLVIALLQSKKLFVGLVVTVVLAVVMVPATVERLSDLGQATTASGAPGNSLQWRIQFWGETLSTVQNPVVGLGLGSAAALTEEGKLPHNDFVRTYVEMGLFGLLSYIWFLWRLGEMVKVALRRSPPGLIRGLAVALAASSVAFLLASFVSNILSQLVILWYFATIAGAAWAAVRLSGNQPDQVEGVPRRAQLQPS